MKRIAAIIVALFGLYSISSAQVVFSFSADMLDAKNYKVTATAVDSLTNENLSFVSAYLRHTSDTLITNFALSDTDGKIELNDVTPGNYFLIVEYLGYQKYQKEIYIRKETNAGTLRLKPDVRALEAATVTAAGREVEFKQDTIIFNASLFKTGSNDNLAALLKRMPGVEISKEGTVTVNGKAVDKITIEGKTFFMDDKSAALNNLPASIVDKIKVIDKDSDEAKISGIKDIQKERVMDVELKEEYKKGFFGNAKIAGGAAISGGRDDEFLETDKTLFNSSLMASLYDEKDQLTIIGNAHNVTDPTAMMVMVYSGAQEASEVLPSHGIHTSWDLGANLNSDRLKSISSTISARHSEDKVDYHNLSDRTTYQTYQADLQDTDETFTTGNSQSTNLSAEFKKLDGNIFSFTFNPSLRFSRVNQNTTENGTSYLGNELQHSSNIYTGSKDQSLYAAANLNGSFKFASNSRRRLGVTLDWDMTDGNGDAYDRRTVNYSTGAENQSLYYVKTTSSRRIDVSVNYVEPIAENWVLQVYADSESQDINRNKTAFGETGLVNDIYSSYTNNSLTTHKLRLLSQYSKGATRINIGSSANLTENHIKSTSAGITTDTGKGDWIFNIAPYINASGSSKDYKSTYQFGLFSNIQSAGTTSMSSAINISSPARLSVGNIYLKPYVDQTITSMYQKTLKNGSLMLNCFATLDKNSITNAIWYDSRNIMYSVPVNVKDPAITSTGVITYETALTKNGKLRFGIDVYGTLNSSSSYQTTSQKDGFDLTNFDYKDFMSKFWGNPNGDLFYSGKSGFQKSKTSRYTTEVFPALKLNLDNFYMRLFGSVETSSAKYSLDSRADIHTVDLESGLELNYTTKHEFELGTTASYTTYHGYRGMFNDPICNWNASILKNIKAFTIGVSVNDILNQARTKSTSWANNYSEYQFINTIGRYVLLSVKFNFGKMNAAKSSAAQQAQFQMLF